MLKLLPLLLLLSSSLSSWGLDKTSNVYKYHLEIAKAEHNLLIENYQEALQDYHLAFNQGIKPFSTDLYNALMASMVIQNDSLTELFANRLAEKGVGGTFFKKKAVFKRISYLPYWNDLLKKADAAKNKLQISNRELIHHIQLISYASNDLYKQWANSLNGREKKESELEKTMNMQNRYLAGDLMDFMDRHGYPSEDIIGVNIINDTMISFEPIFSRLILSSYSQPNGIGSSSMTPYLDKALDAGLIKPGYYGRMRDFQVYENSKHFGTRIFSGFRGTIYYFRIEDLNELDKNRDDIGLATLKEYVSSIQYVIKHPKGPFLFYVSFSETDEFLKSEEEIKNFLNAHVKYPL